MDIHVQALSVNWSMLSRNGLPTPFMAVHCLWDCYWHVHHVLLLSQVSGWTALFYAAKEGHLDMVRELIGTGADVLLKDQVCILLLTLCNLICVCMCICVCPRIGRQHWMWLKSMVRWKFTRCWVHLHTILQVWRRQKSSPRVRITKQWRYNKNHCSCVKMSFPLLSPPEFMLPVQRWSPWNALLSPSLEADCGHRGRVHILEGDRDWVWHPLWSCARGEVTWAECLALHCWSLCTARWIWSRQSCLSDISCIQLHMQHHPQNLPLLQSGNRAAMQQHGVCFLTRNSQCWAA